MVERLENMMCGTGLQMATLADMVDEANNQLESGRSQLHQSGVGCIEPGTLVAMDDNGRIVSADQTSNLVIGVSDGCGGVQVSGVATITTTEKPLEDYDILTNTVRYDGTWYTQKSIDDGKPAAVKRDRYIDELRNGIDKQWLAGIAERG